VELSLLMFAEVGEDEVVERFFWYGSAERENGVCGRSAEVDEALSIA
jgi:hypothetical protein